MDILGVDFSGAKSDDRTWVARAVLDHGELILDDCRPTVRAQLAETLMSLPGGSVAALDFPFSVPESFARFWQPDVLTMPQLWSAASAMDLAQFIELRDEFVAEQGEPKRRCDLRFPECYSCLHKANPNMVPMTFYGMRLLGPLWAAGCEVPPLPSDLGPQQEPRTVLLEAMPGAALKAMGLPHKGYKKGAKAQELRNRILDGLEERSGVAVQNLDVFRGQCLRSDDCLDAIVAAIVAALWVKDSDLFWQPSVDGAAAPDRVALLEGWLYAPVFL